MTVINLSTQHFQIDTDFYSNSVLQLLVNNSLSRHVEAVVREPAHEYLKCNSWICKTIYFLNIFYLIYFLFLTLSRCT